jgi:hypothetical protein
MTRMARWSGKLKYFGSDACELVEARAGVSGQAEDRVHVEPAALDRDEDAGAGDYSPGHPRTSSLKGGPQVIVHALKIIREPGVRRVVTQGGLEPVR